MESDRDESGNRGPIARQYAAALKMLRRAIELCPDELWADASYRNQFWHIAYHTLFYAHLYSQRNEVAFQPWPKHKEAIRMLGGGLPAEELASLAYSKAELLEYHELCCAEVAARVAETNLEADSGFYWLPFNKFELQLYNIRHIQHHTGQLTERLRHVADIGVPWIGK
jgi:DinB superfamily